jgi:hypothetical protein
MTDIKEKIVNNELFTGELALAKTFEIDSSRLNESTFVDEKLKILSDVLRYIGYEYGSYKCGKFVERLNITYHDLFKITFNDNFEVVFKETKFGKINLDLCLRIIFKNLYQNFKLSHYGEFDIENCIIHDALYSTAKSINKSKAEFVINIIIRIVNMEFFNSYYDDLFNTTGKSLPFDTRFKQLALELSLVGDFIKEINSNFHDTVIYSNCNNLGEYTLKLRDELIDIIKLKTNQKTINNRNIKLSADVAYSIINLMEYELNTINVSMTYDFYVKNIIDKNIKLLNEFCNRDLSKDSEQLKMLLDGKEVKIDDFIKDIKLTVDKYLFS